jgi:hypothetical protein
MEISAQIHDMTALPTGKRTWIPMSRKLGGHQSQCERFRKEKNLLLLPEYESWIFQPVT